MTQVGAGHPMSMTRKLMLNEPRLGAEPPSFLTEPKLNGARVRAQREAAQRALDTRNR